MPSNISQTSQISNRSGIITGAGTLLSANANRQGVIIQNLGTNPLYVAFGSGASKSGGVLDCILKGGAVNDDGLGGMITYDVLSYTGIITVDGTSIRCTGTDF